MVHAVDGVVEGKVRVVLVAAEVADMKAVSAKDPVVGHIGHCPVRRVRVRVRAPQLGELSAFDPATETARRIKSRGRCIVFDQCASVPAAAVTLDGRVMLACLRGSSNLSVLKSLRETLLIKFLNLNEEDSGRTSGSQPAH